MQPSPLFSHSNSHSDSTGLRQMGLLLVNLGTTSQPTEEAVGTYLKEFLMDPYVIDNSVLLRWILVHCLIIPNRVQSVAQLYQSIWQKEGSPLLIHSKQLKQKLQERWGEKISVKLGMRYGNPSLRQALEEFCVEKISDLVVFPLYPQFSDSATTSAVEKVQQIHKEIGAKFSLHFIPPFFDDPNFLDAFAQIAAPQLQDTQYDLVLFSFHGLPERHVRKYSFSEKPCLFSSSCCEEIHDYNRNCYRAQCFATAKALAIRLNISKDKYRVCFQSRLGRTKWIEPYTDSYYEKLPQQGIKKLVVICPSFVADCLETLEEVAVRGRKQFQEKGGTELTLITTLNSSLEWCNAIEKIVQKNYHPRT